MSAETTESSNARSDAEIEDPTVAEVVVSSVVNAGATTMAPGTITSVVVVDPLTLPDVVPLVALLVDFPATLLVVALVPGELVEEGAVAVLDVSVLVDGEVVVVVGEVVPVVVDVVLVVGEVVLVEGEVVDPEVAELVAPGVVDWLLVLDWAMAPVASAAAMAAASESLRSLMGLPLRMGWD